MSRKEELLKIAVLLRSQADVMSSGKAKQAFRKMAAYYQHEAKLLQRGLSPEVIEQRRRDPHRKSAA